VSLENTISRFRNETVALNYTLQGLTMTTTVYNTQQDTQTAVAAGLNDNLQSLGAYTSLGFPLGPDINANVGGGYHRESLAVGRSDGLDFGAGAFYDVALNTQLYVEANYLKRFSGDIPASLPGAGDLSIASVRVGLRHTF
jgi:predicted porin